MTSNVGVWVRACTCMCKSVYVHACIFMSALAYVCLVRVLLVLMRLCLRLVCTYVSVCARIAVRACVSFVSNVTNFSKLVASKHNALS